jgi:hypothetical protein
MTSGVIRVIGSDSLYLSSVFLSSAERHIKKRRLQEGQFFCLCCRWKGWHGHFSCASVPIKKSVWIDWADCKENSVKCYALSRHIVRHLCAPVRFLRMGAFCVLCGLLHGRAFHKNFSPNWLLNRYFQDYSSEREKNITRLRGSEGR